MVPGLLTVGVLFSVMGVGTSIAEERTKGVIDRFRSLPMPPAVVLFGRAAGDLLLAAFVLVVTTGVSIAVGFRPDQGLQGLLTVLAMCLLTALAFTWVFIAVGLAVGTVQAAQGLGFLVMPLSFVSSAYVPVETMPGWLQAFAMNQPLTLIIEANRYLAHGDAALTGPPHSGGYYVATAITWCICILAVATVGSLVLFRRR